MPLIHLSKQSFDKSFVIVIQGFGNVGAWAAELITEQGGKVVAVSDVVGAVHNDKGLNIKALRQHIATGKTLASYPEGTSIDKSTILTIPCDVLIPAAIGGVINLETASKVDAKIVIEAANGPTTPEGDKVRNELMNLGISCILFLFPPPFRF